MMMVNCALPARTTNSPPYFSFHLYQELVPKPSTNSQLLLPRIFIMSSPVDFIFSLCLAKFLLILSNSSSESSLYVMLKRSVKDFMSLSLDEYEKFFNPIAFRSEEHT